MFALGGSRGKDSLEEARRPHDLGVSQPESVSGDGFDHAGDGSGYNCGMGTSYSAAQMVSTEVTSPSMH